MNDQLPPHVAVIADVILAESRQTQGVMTDAAALERIAVLAVAHSQQSSARRSGLNPESAIHHGARS